MLHFLATIEALQDSYLQQLRFFETYSSQLKQQVQRNTNSLVSWEERWDESQSKDAEIREFPRVPPHTAWLHPEELDDVRYMDFPHHTRLNEQSYADYEKADYEAHSVELEEIFKKNYKILWNFQRYLDWYNWFCIEYISLLLEEIRLKEVTEKQWTIYSLEIALEKKTKKEYIQQRLREMNDSWEKNKAILKKGLERMYSVSLAIERYFSILTYVINPENTHYTASKNSLEKAIEDVHTIWNALKYIGQFHPGCFHVLSHETLLAQKEQILALLSHKKYS